MASLTKLDFFSYKAPIEKVEVPLLNGEIFVRPLTGKQRDRYEISQDKAGKGVDFRARLMAFFACDETGSPLFDESDIPELSELPAAILDPILEAAIRVNKISAEEVAELEKN